MSLITIAPKKGSIEERVITAVKQELKGVQQEHDKHCDELFETMRYNIEQEKLKYEEAKEEHADMIVRRIVGKLL